MMRIGIAITFFVSGFVSLTMQVAWRKTLSQTIGVDFFSTTLVVTIFMLGLALGAEVGKRCLRRMSRPLLAFAAAEAFVTLFGLVSIPLIRLVPEISLALGTGISIQGYVADFAVNALLLLLPTIAMGVSFPIIVHYFRQVFAPGAAVGFLYSANIFGAATGAFISGMLLIGTLGLITTVVFATLLNLMQVAYIGILMWRRADIEINRPVGAATSASQPRFPVLAIAFAIGFIALAFEMVFVRSAVMYFTANNYVFPVVVTCYLVLMALGNNVAGNLLNRGTGPKRLFMWAALVASGTILISLYLPTALTSAGISLESLKIFQPELTRGGGWILIASMVAVSLVMMLPVAAVSAMFPVFVHAITSDRDKVGENVATVYFVQTLGNVTGAAIAGFVILPLIGAVLTLQLCAAAIVLCAVLFVGRLDVRAAVAAVVAALCFAITPAAYYSNVTYYGKSPTRFSEEIEGIALKYDTSSSTFINIGAERSTGFTTSPIIKNAIDDTIPLYEAVAGKRIESALIIGIGTSSLALQIRHRNPDAKIVIVELLDVVIREMQERGSPAIKKLLQTSRVHITDGRRYVAKQAIPIGERFDFIQIGVFHVTSSGAGGLFTKEFQTDLRSLLTPDGAISYNAYLPAVKVGFEIFEKGLVYTRELGRQMTNALFFNNPQSDIGAALQRYHHVVSDITFADDPNLKITVPNWYFSADDAGYVIPKSDAMLAMLQHAARQTDDLPATEFFLSQQTVWPLDPYYSTTRNDPRYWENVGGFALDGTDGSLDLAQGATRADAGNTITFDLPEAAIVRGCDLAGSPNGKFPSAWTVEGSNDGTTWQEIDRVANFDNWEGVSGGRVYPKYGRVFWFKNEKSFDRYRFNFDRPAKLRIRLFENSVFDHAGRNAAMSSAAPVSD